MNYQIKPLQQKDTISASTIDKKWFGDYGISPEELTNFIQENPENTIGIFSDGVLKGFATFEILDEKMPKDYVGKILYRGKAMFLSNFTTVTNYSKTDFSIDSALLQAIEQKAKELHCHEIWEGLSIDHPYKTENNPQFDAFGFYTSHGGFTVDMENPLKWEPSSEVSIPCYLFRKKM